MADALSTSKKQSVANWLSKLRNPPVFFLDRSLGRLKVSAALRKVGASVEVHDEHFPQDAPDELWLKKAGENGWVVLTKDKNIRFHSREKDALVAHGVKAFVLTAKALNAEEMADVFVRALPSMARVLGKHEGPFVATVTQSADVKIVWPKKRS